MGRRRRPETAQEAAAIVRSRGRRLSRGRARPFETGRGVVEVADGRAAARRASRGSLRRARAVRFDAAEVGGFLLRLCAAWERWGDPADRLAVLLLLLDVAPPYLFLETPALRAWWAEHPGLAIGGVTLTEAEDEALCVPLEIDGVRLGLLEAGGAVRSAHRKFEETARAWALGGAG